MTNSHLTSPVQSARKPKLFYGWWIVIAGAVMFSVVTIVYTQGMIHFTHETTSYYALSDFSAGTRWDPRWISNLDFVLSIFPFTLWVNMVFSPFVGIMVDRFGPRRIVFSGAMIGASGFLVASVADATWDYRAAILVVAIGMNLCATVVFVATIGRWFVQRRVLAFSILMGATIFSSWLGSLLAYSIYAFGWRASMVAVAILVLLVGIPVAMVMRRCPESHGVSSDGEKQRPPTKLEISASAGQVLRLRAFWQITIAIGIAGWVGSIQFINDYLAEASDTSASQAGWIFLAAGLLNLAGIITIGFVGDQVNRRALLTKLLILKAIVTGIMALLSGNFVDVPFGWIPMYAAYLCDQFASGVLLPLSFALLADYFGRKSLGAVIGINSSVIGILGVVLAFAVLILLGSIGSSFRPEHVLAMFGVIVAFHMVRNLEPQSRVAARIKIANRARVE